MKKSEMLRVAKYLATAYNNLIGCTEGKDKNCIGVKYIPVADVNWYELTGESIKNLSDFILDNENWDLYARTFDKIDLGFLNKVLWRLDEVWSGLDSDLRANIIIENYGEARKYKDFKLADDTHRTRQAIKSILGEAMTLQPIFKNLLPPKDTQAEAQAQDTSTPKTATYKITNSVIPKILESTEAQALFAKMIDLGYMERAENGYKWLGVKRDLALFVELMSEKFGIRSKWKIFEPLFGVKKLAQERYKAIEVEGNYINKEIEALFK